MNRGEPRFGKEKRVENKGIRRAADGILGGPNEASDSAGAA